MPVDSFHTSGHSPGLSFNRPTAVVPTASRYCLVFLGFGTVESAVARRLASHAVRDLDLAHIFNSRPSQNHHRLSPRGPTWTDRVDGVPTSEVVVEPIGGIELSDRFVDLAPGVGTGVNHAEAV